MFFTFFFLSRIACCSSRESTSAWQNFRQNQPKKKWVWDFISKVGVRILFSMGNFHFFCRGKTNFLGGGITSKLASQWPSWGIYKHAPPIFWRKRRLLYWKKGGQIKTKSFSWGGQLVHNTTTTYHGVTSSPGQEKLFIWRPFFQYNCRVPKPSTHYTLPPMSFT